MSSLLRELAVQNDSKIVLTVMDGLGGLPHPKTRKTELEAARTPNMDRLAKMSSCGLHHPIAPGITPGSGPAHLGLFGYDPVEVKIGRGVLAACGIGFKLQQNDLAFRLNFATMQDGVITDRRAGRIPTEEGARLCEKLRIIELPGVEVFVEPVMQYRAVVVLRGEGLDPRLADSDPQETGKSPLRVKALAPEANKSAELVNTFIDKAREVLKDEPKGNMILARGFDRLPDIPTLEEAYGLKSAVIATYPMYKGLGAIAGMDIIKCGKEIADEFEALQEVYNDYDFIFLHIKPTDSAGEDGNYDLRVQILEEVDSYIPVLERLQPKVLVITGDHSTPASLQSHSWHPVPIMLHSPTARIDSWLDGFSERSCAQGSLGVFPAKELMALMLAHAGRLIKYGA